MSFTFFKCFKPDLDLWEASEAFVRKDKYVNQWKTDTDILKQKVTMPRGTREMNDSGAEVTPNKWLEGVLGVSPWSSDKPPFLKLVSSCSLHGIEDKVLILPKVKTLFMGYYHGISEF